MIDGADDFNSNLCSASTSKAAAKSPSGESTDRCQKSLPSAEAEKGPRGNGKIAQHTHWSMRKSPIPSPASDSDQFPSDAFSFSQQKEISHKVDQRIKSLGERVTGQILGSIDDLSYSLD